MSDDLKLTVDLVGADEDHGDVQLVDFRAFCESLEGCLRRVEDVVSADSPHLRYLIDDLKKGSANFTIVAARPRHGPDRRSEVIRVFATTINRLESGDAVDPRWTAEALKAFRRLAEPITKRLKRISIGGTRVTTSYIANIDRILGEEIPSEGSVKGRLEKLNLHNANEFMIYPPIEGYAVKCVFPEDLFELVHGGIRKTVTVFGTLYHRPDSPFPEMVLVKNIEIHKPDSELPRLSDMKGTWENSFGGMTPVQFLQSIRHE